MQHRHSPEPRPADLTDLNELIEAGATLVHRGLVLASGGNLSLRAQTSSMWITSAGAWLDRLGGDAFVHVGFTGKVSGRGLPSSEWLLHARAYATRPDVGCVLHLHPQTSLLLDALGKQIRFLTQDHMLYVGSYGRTPYFANGSADLAESAAAQLRKHDVVLMSNHGIVVVGEDLAEAMRIALNFEEAALMTYRALLLGDEATTFPAERLEQLGRDAHSTSNDPDRSTSAQRDRHAAQTGSATATRSLHPYL